MMRLYWKRSLLARQSVLYSPPPPSFPYSGHHYATESSCSRQPVINGVKDENDTKRVDLEIISRGSIKPAYPTPYHLRTFKLSIIDQLFFDSDTPTILFLPNTNNASVSDVIKTRSGRLKESLSELLTQYYPFAGEIVENLHIACNDKGVYFVEARVNETLEEFLHVPDDLKVKELIPKHPITNEYSLGNFVISVQVNIFNCGGIGLCTSLSHKLVDGTTYFTFMKAWAAAASGSSEVISPVLVASDIFPNNPFIKQWPSKLWTTKSPVTKRFVFDSMALGSLKAISVPDSLASPPSRGLTRTEVTAAFVWKAAAKAASTVRRFGPDTPHALFTFVNLRKRASPPLPKELIGNVISAGTAICFPEKQPDLATLMGEVRESISKLNSDYVESLKREKGHETFIGFQKMINDLMEVMNEEDCLFATSLLNSGIYEMDFGWGKPIWFYHMNPGCSRIVSLNDVKKGGGVEAIVSLSSEEMEIFEHDPEVLSYAAVNPSLLTFLN